MAAKKDPAAGNDVADQLAAIAAELTKMNTKFANGITAEAIAKVVGEVRAQIPKIVSLTNDLRTLTDAKNANLRQLEALRKQARDAVVGQYGDDSPQYAAVGGTKRSERKRPVRKPKA
ncbi:MAG: hypothetical protein FJZ01_27250 [Candidatus Sericytochromatia bacterium]|nr:hypothetical protein [Candidatus Tanganyikabacteria bacterium]